MKKRILLPLIAAAAAMAGTTIASAQDIHLSFRFNDPEAKQMRAALDEFEKENPGVKVELQTISWGDARTQFLREAAVGEGPDVIHIAFVWPRDMGKAGALLPLNDLMKSDPLPIKYSDYVATDLAIAPDGKIYGVPWTTDTWAMVYRTDLLKKAGITEIPRTWEDVRAASRAVYEKTGKVGFGFPAGSSSNNTIWFLANYYWWSHGQALVAKTADGGFKTGITVDQIVDSMKYFQSYLDEGDNPKSMLSVNTWNDPSIIEGMTNGDQAIAIMTPYDFKAVLAAFKQRNPGVTPPFVSAPDPAGPAGPKSHLGGRMLGINANTEHPEMAWKLLKFLARVDTLKKYYGDQFPAQKPALETVDFGPYLAGFAKELTFARSWADYSESPAQIGKMWDDTGRAFGQAFIGEKTDKEAATALLQSVEDQLK